MEESSSHYNELCSAEFEKIPKEYRVLLLDNQPARIYYSALSKNSQNDLLFFRPDRPFTLYILKVKDYLEIEFDLHKIYDICIENYEQRLASRVEREEVPVIDEQSRVIQRNQEEIKHQSRTGRVVELPPEITSSVYEIEFGHSVLREIKQKMSGSADLQDLSPYTCMKLIPGSREAGMFICAKDSRWMSALQNLLKVTNPDFKLMRNPETVGNWTKLRESFRYVPPEEFNEEYFLIHMSQSGNMRSLELWKDFRLVFLTPICTLEPIVALSSVDTKYPDELELDITRHVSEVLGEFSRSTLRSFVMYSKIRDFVTEICCFTPDTEKEYFKQVEGRSNFPTLAEHPEGFWGYRRLKSKLYKSLNLKNTLTAIDELQQTPIPFQQYSGHQDYAAWGSALMNSFELLHFQEQVYRKELILDAQTRGMMKEKKQKRGGRWRTLKLKKNRLLREKKVVELTSTVLATMNFADQGIPETFHARHDSLPESSSTCLAF